MMHTDLDNDGFIPLQDLASTEGIERQLVDDVVDDVGACRLMSIHDSIDAMHASFS